MRTNHIAAVTSKEQVTIPKAVRKALKIEGKDQLLFVLEEDRVVVVPLHHRSLSELYGILSPTRPYPGHQTIRGELQNELGDRINQGID